MISYTTEINSTILILIIYIMTSIIGFFIFYKLKVSSLKSLPVAQKKNFFLKFSLVIFFLNLSGVPPLPGFFIKINFLFFFLKKTNLIISGILLIINFAIFYLYIQFFKYVYTYTKAKFINTTCLVIRTNTLNLFILLNFYPIYVNLILII